MSFMQYGPKHLFQRPLFVFFVQWVKLALEIHLKPCHVNDVRANNLNRGLIRPTSQDRSNCHFPQCAMLKILRKLKIINVILSTSKIQSEFQPCNINYKSPSQGKPPSRGAGQHTRPLFITHCTGHKKRFSCHQTRTFCYFIYIQLEHLPSSSICSPRWVEHSVSVGHFCYFVSEN